MRCSCNRRRMLLVHKSPFRAPFPLPWWGVCGCACIYIGKPKHANSTNEPSFHSWNCPDCLRGEGEPASQLDCMFGLSSFSTASRIKCIKYENETIGCCCSNISNIKATPIATTHLLTCSSPLYRGCSSGVLCPGSQVHPQCLSHIHIHILHTSTSRAGGAPAANCFAIMRFFALPLLCFAANGQKLC